MENIGITAEMQYQIKKGLARQYWEYELNRLAEFEEKIKNNTLVELPCKVGDTVYVINYRWLKYREYKVRAIEIRTSDIFFTLTDDLGDKFRVKGVWAEQVSINSFKDEWFLTREEAEKRLEELKNA